MTLDTLLHRLLIYPMVVPIILLILVIGLIAGLGIRLLRLHVFRDYTPLTVSAIVFVGISLYIGSIRIGTWIYFQRDYLYNMLSYLILAFLFCTMIYAGKWLTSWYIHRRANKLTAKRGRAQLDAKRRERAARDAPQPGQGKDHATLRQEPH